MVQPLSGRYLARLFRGRTVQPGSRGSRPVFPPDDSQHRAGGFRGIFGRIRGLVRQGRPRCLRHPLAGRPGGLVHAAQDEEHPCYRVIRAGRAGAVPRRASAARGAMRHPFQYQRRHRGLDGCIHGLYQNPDPYLLWRQPAGDGRTAGTVRVDAPSASDAQVGGFAQ